MPSFLRFILCIFAVAGAGILWGLFVTRVLVDDDGIALALNLIGGFAIGWFGFDLFFKREIHG